MPELFSFEGRLRICDQEGGYAAPDILIDEESIPVLIEAIFSSLRPKGAESIEPPGRYRLRLEEID